MTVSSSTNKVSFNGDGSTTVFAYSFKVFDESDLTVILRASDGTETTQTITTNYTVSGVGDAGGGNVTMVTAPASGEQLTILREQPLTQGLDLVPNDPFPANSIEDSLDKLTFMVQQHQEELDRSIKASKTTTISTVEFVESAATRANKVFAFDGSGDLDLTQEIGTFQGDWAASTAYAVRDIVKDTNNNNIYIANTAHTSSGTVPLTGNADIAKWDLLVNAAAATTSANNAATSATAAATSATAAATSATAASTSESNAATSASNASTSETNASASATNAATSESNAAGSESAAATSETNAATSATNASTSASAAATSATNAATSESNASTSQSAAAASATAAATSATSAATNATNAATSATNASTAQTAAETAQTAAEAAQAAAELAADNFDDTYLGSKSSDPTVDNDGGALNAGDLYFNTTSNTLKVYSGSAWQDAAIDSSGFVQTTGDTLTGNLSFGDNVKAQFGAGDLQIFHDGNNSFINELGTGSLYVRAQNTFNLQKAGTSEFMLRATTDGAVQLYYDNAEKLATSSTGVDITGEVKADKFTNDEALPDVRPSLLLDFANSKTLDPRITFTRGSTATYWDGKTTTKAEENLAQRSQEFDNGYWAKAGITITANNTTAPDGTTTADKAEITTTGSYRNVAKSISGSASTTYTFSVYLKAGNYNYVGAQVQSRTSANAYINTAAFQAIDLSTGSTIGTTTGSSVITDVGNGWYRLQVTGTLASNAGTAFVDFIFTDSSGNAAPSTPVASGSNIYAWGAQLEQRSSATAYTATTSSPIVKYQPTLQTAASGEARFDHDPVTGESKGLLIEESRTNLIANSEDFTSFANADKFANSVIAPDGQQTADEFVGTGGDVIYVNKDLNVTSGTTYTISEFVKLGSYTGNISILLYGTYFNSGGTNIVVNFDIANKAVSGTPDAAFTGYGIEDVGNGWVRIWGTAVATATGNVPHQIARQSSGIQTGKSFYIWGAQLEASSFPTSYIPTSGSTVTRAVEQVTMSNIAPELNGQEGTLYIEATPPDYATGDQRLVSIGSSHSNVVEMFREYSSTNFFFAIRHAGTTVSQGSTAWAADTTAKAAIGYKSGDIGFAADGSLIMTNTGTFAGMEMNQMLIGRTYQGGASAWSGEIKKIAYYPQKFTNATLQAMTEE